MGTIKSRALLLATAIIWGLAFVSQRDGMQYVQPFTFNGVRFALGFLVLIPFGVIQRNEPIKTDRRMLALGGLASVLVLFIGSTLQQFGVAHTTAGKAGFITGLYVILVPIVGIALRHRIGWLTWLSALVGVVGLYLLTVTESFTIEYGDLLVLVGAFFWAAHVHLIAHFSSRISTIPLTLMQIAFCSILSLGAAFAFETIQIANLMAGAIPILYTGVLSVGIAYTLQVMGQRGTPPTQAALIMCLEAVFAVLGGWLILGETLPLRGFIGCGLMFAGMVAAQFDVQT